MIRLSDVSKTFDSTVFTPAAVSFDMDDDRRLALLEGRNGCGKTTLLKIISGEETATTGFVEPNRQRDVAIMYQNEGLLPEITARENLVISAAHGNSIEKVVARVGLRDTQLSIRAKRLSGGEERRVQLARAIASQRKLWLLDEPTSHADKTFKSLLVDAVTEHLTNGGMAIIVSHDHHVKSKLRDQAAKVTGIVEVEIQREDRGASE